MKYRLGLLCLITAVLTSVLVGCGGGGGGGGTVEVPGVTLTLETSALPTGTRDIRGVGANLDEGASVVVLNYATGEELDRGTLNASGTCDVQLTPGLTVVVIITGTRTDGDTVQNYRLSRIIPVVPQADTTYMLDPITSMAAEAIAQAHPVGAGTILSQDIVDAVQAEADSYAGENGSADYSVGGGIFGNANFGASGSVAAGAIANVMTKAQEQVVNTNMVLAKNAVQQMKEAGVPLAQMTGNEFTDADTIYWAVQDKYRALGDRVGEYMIAAIVGNMTLGGNDVSIFDLTMGNTYTMTCNEFNDRTLTDNGAGTPNQVTINCAADGGTYTIVGTMSTTAATIVQTFTGDPDLEYRISLPQFDPNSSGINPSFTATISLTDEVFTQPLAFEGTVSAAGGPQTFSRISYEGTLTSPNLSSSGTFQVNFRTSLPEGAHPDASVMDFITSASMSDAHITVTNGGTTIRLAGAISATTAVITNEWGYADIAPKTFELEGSYSNSASDLAFNGSISGDWTNPGWDLEPWEIVGTLSVDGQLTREGYPTYLVGIDVALDEGDISSDIDLRVGSSTLQGTFTGTLDTDGPPYGDLVLTNQAGVKFNVSISDTHDVTGTVTVGVQNTQVATIGQNGDLMVITYATDPVTYDEF